MIYFTIGDWLVNVPANECVKDGKTVRLESKVMAVLQYFARHPAELISREQLEHDIWGNTVVGYDAVTGCIAKLRKVFGDNPKSPAYIETISKKGYRLIAAVKEQSSLIESKKRKRFFNQKKYQLATVISLIALLSFTLFKNSNVNKQTPFADTTQPSIVVLPFKNMSNDPDQIYFSDGIYADISTALSKISGLLVISPSSANSFRNVNPTNNIKLKQVSDELGARYIMQGNVRKDASRLRMNVNLIDTRNNTLLWSEKYDRDLVNTFEVQDEITAQIIQTLSLTLTEDEKRKTAKRYTRSFRAYDEFLKGQALYVKHNQEDNRLAREQFQHAILLDANFARAYSSIALTYVSEHRYGWNVTDTSLIEKALKYAQQGITFDATLPQSYWVLAYVNLFSQDYLKAARAAEHSIQIAPSFADSYISLAICKLHFNQPKEALGLIKQAMLINPRYPAAYASVLGQIYYAIGDYESAAYSLTNAIERNINLLTPHIFLVATLTKLGRLEDAKWNSEQILIISPGFRLTGINELFAIRNPEVIADITHELKSIGFK